MSEPRLDPKLSTSPSARRGRRYLVKRGESWRFQIRIPVDLDPFRKLGPLRKTLGPMSIRTAERRARMLVAAAEGVFAAARVRKLEMEGEQDDRDPMTAAICADPLGFFMAARWALIRSEIRGVPEPQLSPEAAAIKDIMVDHIELNREIAAESGSPYVKKNAERLRADLMARYDRVGAATKNRDPGEFGNEGSPNGADASVALTDRLLTMMDRQNGILERLTSTAIAVAPAATPHKETCQSDDTRARPASGRVPVTLPLFSEAAKNYLHARIRANGGIESADIKAIRGRVSFFLGCAEDKPIDCYEHDDFQKLVDKLQYWPPEPESHDDLAGKSIDEIVAINKEKKHKYGIMAKNTVKGHYIVEMRTILDDACVINRITNPVPRLKLKMPRFKEPIKRKAPNVERLTEAFRVALSYGSLDHLMLLLLGMLTGRRIGFLAYLRGKHFSRVGEFVVIRIPQHVIDPATGAVTETPIKTSDALCGIVLHRLFDDIGFIDWAIGLGDQYVFPNRHDGLKDPEDAAQKLVNGVLTKAETGGTFHGFRHWYITALRNASVSELSNRVQVGHAARDEHEHYGELPVAPEDALKIKNLALPPGVDFSLFYGLDFDALRNGTNPV